MTLQTLSLTQIRGAAERHRIWAAERSFQAFVEQAWHVLEPHTPFVPGIHVEAICAHLQAVSEGRIADLLINVPPGHAKSLLACVFWPAWDWINNPQRRFVFSTYKEDLTLRDSVKCRQLIRSDWYQTRWSKRFRINRSQDQKHRFVNSETGYRVVVTVGSGTGERGDVIVCDDATSVDQAESDAERTKSNEWWLGTMSTRLNNRRTGHLVGIQQRLHEQDFTGTCLKLGTYVHVCLPARYEPERACVTPIWRDPRTQAGELLWPARMGDLELSALEHTLGPYRFAGQYQQRPSPAAGGIFRRHHWQYWQPRGANLPKVPVELEDRTIEMREAHELPETLTRIAESWDLGKRVFHESDDNVAGGKWGAYGANRYLLDQVCKPMDMAQTMAAMEAMSKTLPIAGPRWVESAANGPAVIVALRDKVPGLIPVPAMGTKTARAHACSAEVVSGNVYLPHPDLAPWVKGFIEEAAVFPNGAHDDQVDQMTMALNQFRATGPVYDIEERMVAIPPTMVLPSWPQAFSLAFTGSATGVLWASRDAGGDLLIVGERKVAHAEPNETIRILTERGKWIPGLVEATTPGRNVADGVRALRSYTLGGISVSAVDYSPEAGTQATLQMFSGNRIKIFSTCPKLLQELRGFWKDKDGKNPEGDYLLMQCLRILCLHKERLRTRPEPPKRLPSRMTSERGWMAG